MCNWHNETITNDSDVILKITSLYILDDSVRIKTMMIYIGINSFLKVLKMNPSIQQSAEFKRDQLKLLRNAPEHNGVDDNSVAEVRHEVQLKEIEK